MLYQYDIGGKWMTGAGRASYISTKPAMVHSVRLQRVQSDADAALRNN